MGVRVGRGVGKMKSERGRQTDTYRQQCVDQTTAMSQPSQGQNTLIRLPPFPFTFQRWATIGD